MLILKLPFGVLAPTPLKVELPTFIIVPAPKLFVTCPDAQLFCIYVFDTVHPNTDPLFIAVSEPPEYTVAIILKVQFFNTFMLAPFISNTLLSQYPLTLGVVVTVTFADFAG